MAEIIRMPKLSDTMTEGVVAEWHKKIGDEVESGELLAEIETTFRKYEESRFATKRAESLTTISESFLGLIKKLEGKV